MALVINSQSALITITPVNLDENGVLVNKGQPIEVTIAEFAAIMNESTPVEPPEESTTLDDPEAE